jgi:beta-carotene hydroxylase
MPDMSMDRPQNSASPASEMSDAVALQIAMQEAAAPAWGTVALFVVEISMWAYSGYAAITHIWPIWLCFIVSTVAIYMNYTPHHEAVHGSIAGNRRDLVWLNETIGFITGFVFYHGFTMQRVTHLTHHATTNNPEEDPDYWAHGKSPLMIAIRCLSILVPYEMFGWKIMWRAQHGRGRWLLLRSVMEKTIAWGFVIVLIATGHADAAFFAFVIPAALASGMLAFMFDWLVHHPHHVPVDDRYRTSNVYLFPKPLHWPMTVLWIFQNYHIIHHLYPRLAFYRYARVFDMIRPLLEARGTCITVFHWEPGFIPALSYAPAQTTGSASPRATRGARRRDAA